MAKAATAPDTYKGTNTSYPGDPSPEGWHIPSRMEWTIILPFSSGGYGFKFSNNYLNRTEEIDLDGDGVGETYVADYKTITGNSMVGLKFKDTWSELFDGSSAANPIDILATGTAEQLSKVIDTCEKDLDTIDGMVVIFGSPGLFDVSDAYDVIREQQKKCKKPIYAVLQIGRAHV